MDDRTSMAAALRRLRADGFAQGTAWEEGHAIAQRHEGEADFDRVHALLHRIEGDSFNAGYWYRRAGVERFDGPVDQEADLLDAVFSTSGR